LGFLDGTLEQNILFRPEKKKQSIGDLRAALDLSGVTDFMQEQGIDLTYKIRSLTGEGFSLFWSASPARSGATFLWKRIAW